METGKKKIWVKLVDHMGVDNDIVGAAHFMEDPMERYPVENPGLIRVLFRDQKYHYFKMCTVKVIMYCSDIVFTEMVYRGLQPCKPLEPKRREIGLTKCIVNGNLYQWLCFCKFKCHIADEMLKILESLYPRTAQAWKDYERDAITFSSVDQYLLRCSINNSNPTQAKHSTPVEQKEFIKKMDRIIMPSPSSLE